MHSLNEFYVIGRWVNSCLKGFQETGINIAELLDAAHVSNEQLNNNYVPLDAVIRIFNAAEELGGDDVGLNSRFGLVPGTFNYLSLAALSSRSVAEALKLMARYNDYLTNAVHYFVREDEHYFTFGFTPASDVQLNPSITEAILATIIRTIRFINPRKNLLQKISINHKDEAAYQRLQHYAKVPVTFAQCYAVHFDITEANSLSLHYDETLLRKNEQLLLENMAEQSRTDFRAQLVQYLSDHLSAEDLSIEKAATDLQLTVTMLQRRLKKANTNFKTELDNLRRQRAALLLRTSTKSVCYIAQELGFSDAANFCRAFKRWFKCSPEQFRKNQNLPLSA